MLRRPGPPVQNLTAGSAPAPQTPTDPATNHMTGYTYDANGNLTVEPYTPSNNNYGYDGENRMVTFSSGGTSASYTYDGSSLRVKKQSSGTTTVYIFSGQKVIAEYNNGAAPGSPTKEYIYAGVQLLATIASGTTTYHHPDHLSARLNSNSSGTKVGDQGHFPFGESWYLTNTTTKWQFTTYERDSETGNDYALARNHMNRVGRFSSPDPIAGSSGDPQTWNRYAYVANRPLNVTDPSGMLMCLDPEKGNCGGGGIAGWSAGGSEGGGCADADGCDGFADFPGVLAGAGGVCFAGVCIGGNLAGLGTLGAVFNGVVNGDWGGLFPPIPGYNAPPIFDAESACLNGAGPLAVGQSRCAANNGQLQPTLQQKQKQCAGIYQDYKNEISNQAWKNVGTVAVAAVGGCVAGWKEGCLKPAIYAAGAADATLALSNWQTDAINIQYALKLQNAGCASVPGW